MMFLQTTLGRFQRRKGTIVLRLRIVLGLVAVITAMAGIAASLQSREILAAHGQLNRTALPMLIKAQKVQRDLHEMFEIDASISTAQTSDRLEEASDKFSDQATLLRENVRQIEGSLHAPTLALRILNSVDAAEASTQQVMKRRLDILSAQGRVGDILYKIQTVQRDAVKVLERLSFHTTTEIDSVLRASRQDQSVTPEMMDRLFSDLFLTSLNHNNLLIELEAITELARTQQFRNGAQPSEKLRSALNTKLNSVTWRLAQLPDGQGRAALADLTSQLRVLLLDETGLFAQLESQKNLNNELDEARENRSALVLEITELANGLAAGARAGVRASSEALSAATSQLVWTLTTAITISLGTLLVANKGIVEHQISRRMNDLNHSVSAIAEGDLEHPITVSGQDELGDMARALMVFKKNAIELRRSNIELEKFAYVAAHDLRSPLRAIHDLSVWIEEDEENTLSAESKAYLTLMQSRVERLSRMLNDLLDYALAGQSDLSPQDVEMAQLVRQLTLGGDPNGTFNITYDGPVQTVRTYATPLTQIVGNLISNAIKHHDRDTGTISVAAYIAGGRLHLSVADDGPGISKAYREKVFVLFQTLRPRDEVEGSGLGLAIVSKLAEHFGGKVTLTSNPEKERGSRFDVDLPAFEIDQNAAPIAKLLAVA